MTMETPDRVLLVLQAILPRSLCDSCIGKVFGRNPGHTAQIARTLKRENRVHREPGNCDMCGARRSITRAMEAPQG